MNKYKTLASNTALISIGTFGSKLLVFFMVRFYTGYLTPSDYGTADLITQSANLLFPLFSLGITDGVFRFAIDRRGARSSVFTAGFNTVTLGSLILVAFIPLIKLIPQVGDYAWLVVAFVAACCYQALCSQYVRAIGNTKLFAVSGLINTAFVIALNILFLAVWNMGITGYVLSVVAANVLCTIYLIIRAKLWRQLVIKPRKGLTREILKYSIPMIPTTIFWWITGVSDRYMVNGYLGTEANGIYAVAYKIPTMLTIVSTVFMEAWQFSAVSEAQGDRREHIEFYSKIWAAFQAALFVCGVVIVALSQPAIHILTTESFYSAWLYIPVLSAAMIFASFSSFMGSVYVVKEKTTISFYTAMIGAVLNVGLNLLLIPSKLGVQGAAIATLASYLVVFIIRTASARRLIPFRLNAVGVLLNCVVMGVQIVFIVMRLPMWQLVQAIAVVLILILNYKPLLESAAKIRAMLPGGKK